MMKYDPYRHHRRSIRLRGYDYSQPGAYFITICTHNREPFIEAASVKELVRSAWDDLAVRFSHLVLDEFVLMPNHVHGIIILASVAGAPLRRGAASSLRGAASSLRGAASSLRGAASSAPTLGQIVRAFKSLSAIGANRVRNAPNQPFWQRNYYEHIIRDEDELNIVRQYITDNPLKWEQDPDNPANL